MSQTKRKDQAIKLCMGMNTREISPLYLIFRWFHFQKQEAGSDWRERYLFDMTVQQVKKIWKGSIKETAMQEKERWRFHGLRKCFGTALQERGVDKGLVAYAGRWSVVSTSIYKYVLYSLEDMAKIASVLWDKKKITEHGQDMDAYELELLSRWNKTI